MRILITTLLATAFMAGTAFAGHDHDHDKKKTDGAAAEHTEHQHGSHGSGTSYGSDSSYGSGTDGHKMDHSKMDHSNMDHGDGHMMGSKTMPADGAILDHSPKMIGVDFGHAMNVEAITISTLTGEMIALDVSDIGETSHVMVAAPELQADDYQVDWRARGHDGHVMSGSFAFTVE